MHHQRNESVPSHLKSLGGIFFLLLQTQVYTGQPVVATIGDDVILPCLLEPAKDVSGFTLEWSRPDLDPRFVHVQRSGQELVDKTHKLFEGRTSMFIDEQKHGNVSLKLSKVRISDEGTYKCFIPELSKQSFVQLIVASDVASSPVISVAGIDRDSRGLVFLCESAGWYPKPEVFWLDGEGNLLSGSTEINQGPDGLYTVTSTVTVEKRSNFTCRVTQENINHPREGHVHLPDDFFRVSTSSAVPIITGLAVTLAVCLLFVLAGGVFMWRRRQNITKVNEAVRENQTEIAKSVQEEENLINNPSDSKEETFSSLCDPNGNFQR
ncbi:butyrophilin subfamily 3 member A2-like [Melanotaenia boesemani]|uniref:butyrophilin subfamily 3 member A2-like n=1 Tax=Melanotaenia boesemani TaxID=1250792 RepID=UPI001C05866E|nr:butyrophilin subfamily 3 member A2-like [Melanotaenia boesemani]